MADTPKRLVGPLIIGTADAVRYTVPANTTTIVRSIRIANVHASTASQVYLSLGTDAVGTRLLFNFAVPAKGVYTESCFIVLAAAETINASDVTNNVSNLMINGIEVT